MSFFPLNSICFTWTFSRPRFSSKLVEYASLEAKWKSIFWRIFNLWNQKFLKRWVGRGDQICSSEWVRNFQSELSCGWTIFTRRFTGGQVLLVSFSRLSQGVIWWGFCVVFCLSFQWPVIMSEKGMQIHT